MAANAYKGNHYAPCWYQERFLSKSGQRVFRYLDLDPEKFRDPNGIIRTKTALRRWGAANCFKETDLYTVKYGRFESTEIEQFFFGKVDREGKKAVEFFSTYNDFNNFTRGDSPSDMFHALINYMSVQKFRTPKGLKYLSALIDVSDKNRLLIEMQRLQNMHCAIWTESVWALVDANSTRTKFLISDHPVTVYNRDIFPECEYCRKFTDPDFRMNGTHTLFPLSPTRILILTNLSWVRNPYGKALKPRPNPHVFRTAMFNFNRCDHTVAQILRISSSHPCWPPSPAQSMNHKSLPKGIPSDSAWPENDLDALLPRHRRIGCIQRTRFPRRIGASWMIVIS